MVYEGFLNKAIITNKLTHIPLAASSLMNNLVQFCLHGMNYGRLTISARAIYKNIPPASAKIQLAEKWLPARMPKARPT